MLRAGPVKGYQQLLASSVGERDGLGLELSTEDGDEVAEVFRDDVSGERTVTFFTDKPVPLDVVTWFLAAAEDRL